MECSCDNMERFFATRNGNDVHLTKEDEHHLLHVLRVREGDEVEIVDEGDLFLARVVSLSPLSLTIVRPLTRDGELPASLILAFSLLKGGHDEWVLMKGTELGASAFVPFCSSRSIIRLDEKEKAKRLLRFQKIVSGAASQSKRLKVPTVSPILSFAEALSYPADHRFFAYENLADDAFLLPQQFREIKAGESAICMVGPEGGFSPEEAKMALESHWTPISLGRRILRAETASLYLASIFAFLEERE